MKVTMLSKINFIRIFLIGVCLLLLKGTSTYGQLEVKVNINSGNPKFPFPQFLPYEANDGHSLGNLATQNAPGVTHAEMEKLIREAWQIMANGFVYTGDSWAGVKYIKGNVGCPYDCTEGDGYALLAAAEMADKTTFDGLWFRTHDLRMVRYPRYRDGVIPDPNYGYGLNALVDNRDGAADGDFDVAMALLIAWHQWGDLSGYADFNGNPISYKEEALRVIRGLVERTNQKLDPERFDCRSVSGNIGFDGYPKGGNTWKELTTWASSNDPNWCPEFQGPQFLYADYMAPAYYHCFAKFLETEGGSPEDLLWNINQFRRGEASSDWMIGKHYENGQANILHAGSVRVEGSTVTFAAVQPGEDFRLGWRTALNYMWHGNPATSWNPVTHQVENGPNTYQYDMALRHAQFLKNPGKAPWINPCVEPGDPKLSYMGPSQLMWQYTPDGVDASGEDGGFPLNWNAGTGSPSAVVAQDYELMGKLYHMCAIEWDVVTPGDRYLTSVPVYFHGFFRLLGLLTLTGNHRSPTEGNLESNMKVYLDNDKTYAFTGDLITYTVSYRNYASVSAAGVKISAELPEGVEYVSSTGGGVNTGGKIEWNVGSVSGFQTTTGVDPTKGEFTFIVRVAPKFSGRVCPVATITTTNGKGWTSNEYPNNVTPVMERNCVDIVEKALEINKTVNYDKVNPGTELIYEVDFENASSGGYINGGRPDVIPAYAHKGTAAEAAQHWIMFRLYHGAAEPYIDYQNYRFSLFLNDNINSCVTGSDPSCTEGWGLNTSSYAGGVASAVRIFQEDIVPGNDERGAWNQRIVIQFSEQLATSTPHLSRYYGGEISNRVHQGGGAPLRAIWQMSSSTWADVKWDDDWSWNPLLEDAEDGFYYPVANDWTDINNPDRPVTVWHNEACEKPSIFATNLLVEEWDGYTWRRVYGSGPLPGRDVNNVVVTDIIPEGFTFVAFVDENGVEIGNTTMVLDELVTYDEATRTIRWTKDRLQIKQKGEIRYKVIADFSTGACNRANEIQTNAASIYGDNESPVSTSVDVTISCEDIILPPLPSSMTKVSDKQNYDVGEDIVYTLEYENEKGALVIEDFSMSSRWTAQSGTLMNVSDGGLSSVSMNDGVTTHDYAHGVDGTIEASIDFQNSAAFGFAFRHTGGAKANGLYIMFKPNPGNGSTEIKLYNGTTQMGTTINTGFPRTIPSVLKLQLVGDQVNLWIGSTSNPTPTLTFTGFPVRAGYAGFINGWANDGGESYGTHRVVSFKTQLDSGFDIEISDPIPDDVTFVSASDNGVVTGGVLKYPVIKGPVLKGEVVTYTWIGNISSCPANGKIVNNAYTNVHGFVINSIASQNIVSCLGDVVACVLPDTVIVTGVTVIEEGETTTLTAEIIPVQSGYIYNWYKLPNLTTPLSQSGLDQAALTVSDTGRYVVRVVQPGNALCFEESVAIRVVFDEVCTLPDLVVIQGDLHLEAGSTTTLTADETPAQTGWIYNWYKLPDMSSPLAGSGLEQTTLTVSDTGRYVVRLVNENDETCRILSEEVSVGYLCEKADVAVYLDGTELTEPYTVQLCEGQTAVLSFSPQKYDFEFDLRQLFGAVLMEGVPVAAGDTPEITISSADAGSWVFNVYADPGNQGNRLCWSLADVKMITISETSAPAAVITSPEDFEYCEGSDGVSLVASTGTNYVYTWKKDGVVQPNDPQSPTYANATEGVWKVVVAASANCMDSSEVLVVQNISPVAKIDSSGSHSSFCIGRDYFIIAVDAGQNVVYEFLRDGIVQPVSDPYERTRRSSEAGSWVVIVESPEGCQSVSEPFEVVQSETFNLVISGDTVLCEGESLRLTTNAYGIGPIRWDAPGFPNMGANHDLVVSDPVSGIYRVVLDPFNEYGCSGSAQVEVVVEPAGADPVITITGTSFAACVGETLEINTLVSNTAEPVYEWYVNNVLQPGSSSVFSSSTLSQGDWVKVRVTSDGSCRGELTDADSVMVTINELPVASLEADKTTLCADESVELRIISGSTLIDAEWFRNSASVSGTASGLTVNSAGEYRVRITDNRGCISETESIVIDLASLPVLSINGAATTICEGVSVSLEAIADPAGNYQYAWHRGGVLIQGASARVFSAQQAGSYHVELMLNGCTAASDSWVLTETELTAPVINGEESPVCEARGEVYSVAVPAATSTYLWTVPSGAVITSHNGASIIVSHGTSDGAVTVVETNAQGCVSPVATLTVALRYCDLRAGYSSDKTVVCAGDTVEFVNNSAGTSASSAYRWNFGPGAVPSQYQGEGPVRVVFNQSGFANAALTVEENNFSDTYDGTIDVKARPVIQRITGNDLLCMGVTETYTASVSGSAIQSMNWTLSNNLQRITSGSSTIDVQGTAQGQGLISVYMTDLNGCVSDAVERNVSVVEQPVVTLAASKEVICLNESAELSATGGLSYSWYRNDEIISGISGSIYRADKAGEYYVSTGSGACSDVSERVFIQFSELDVDAGFDRMINIGESVQLTAITNGSVDTYFWQPGNVAPMASPIVSPNESTTYTVLVTDIYGCTATDEVHVKVVLPLFIPNAFTPNGDGVHDVWEVQGLERFSDLKVEIYNRWGNLIYSSRGTYKPWDGKKNGEYMPVGTYYYVIDAGDEMKPLTGAVLLSK